MVRIYKIVDDYLKQLKSKDSSVRLKSADEIVGLVEALGEDLEYNEEFIDITKEFIHTLIERLEVEKSDIIRERIVESVREITDKFVFSYEWIIRKLEPISRNESEYLLDLLIEMQKERDHFIEDKLIEQTNHRMKRFRIEAIEELGKTALDKKEYGANIDHIIDTLIECLCDKEELVAEEAGYYLFLISTDYVMKKIFQVLIPRVL